MSSEAIASCAMLWVKAPAIPVPIQPKLKALLFKSRYITSILARPPEKLIKNAVNPLVISTKADFATVTYKAEEKPKPSIAVIVTIFASPGFIPGIINGRSGIKLSNIESTMAQAHIRAFCVRFNVRFFFLSTFCKLTWGGGICDKITMRNHGNFFIYEFPSKKWRSL